MSCLKCTSVISVYYHCNYMFEHDYRGAAQLEVGYLTVSVYSRETTCYNMITGWGPC